MNILAQIHSHYNYLDSCICQGLGELGHNVYALFPGTNYVAKAYAREPLDLFVQFIAGGGAMPGVRSVMVWGEDSHEGLADVFNRGFDEVFVRDHVGGPGVPISFGIETRYLCVTEKGLKPLSEREIDICFLGDLAGYKVNRIKFTEKLKQDFKLYNLELGPRKFNTPDAHWSRWTKPWCAHDPRYFETLANSKICLSFKGAGPDTGRTYEVLASGAFPVIEEYGASTVLPKPKAGWFSTYEEMAKMIHQVVRNPTEYQDFVNEAYDFNLRHHSTKARAQYFINQISLKEGRIHVG